MERNGAAFVALLSVFAADCGEPSQTEDGTSRVAPLIDVSTRVESLERALTKSPNLVAQIRMSDEHAFEIIELRNGAIGYSEVGTYAQRPMPVLAVEDLTDPIKVFQRLAPGRDRSYHHAWRLWADEEAFGSSRSRKTLPPAVGKCPRWLPRRTRLSIRDNRM